MSIPSEYEDFLDRQVFWHVATIGPNGEPQSTPVWAGPDEDGNLLFSSVKGRQKLQNIIANPTVAMSAIDPENPYRYLEIRGTVIRMDEDPDASYIDVMAKKYLGVDEYPWTNPEDERVIVVVAPLHTTCMG